MWFQSEFQSFKILPALCGRHNNNIENNNNDSNNRNKSNVARKQRVVNSHEANNISESETRLNEIFQNLLLFLSIKFWEK